MTPDQSLTLPYIHREMLDFKDGATWAIRIISRGMNASILNITGATKANAFTYRHQTSADGGPSQQDFKIHDIPAFISVNDPGGTLYRPGAYVQVSLMYNGDIVEELIRGYVWPYKSLTWPQTVTEPSVDPSIGGLSVISLSDPAAGAEVSYGRNDSFIYKINALEITLVTDANVANRRVHLRFHTDLGGDWEVASSIDQSAGLTRVYHFMACSGLATYSDDNDIFVPIPERIFMNGNVSSITTVTTNIQAGDNFGVGKLAVESFIAKN